MTATTQEATPSAAQLGAIEWGGDAARDSSLPTQFISFAIGDDQY